MKKVSVLLMVAMMVASSSFGQQQKVAWSYFAKKVKDKTYEIRAIATIAPGWYIYAQQQPPKSIAQPTEFAFTKNPLIALTGNVQEEGTLVKKEFKVLGVTSNTYQDTVSFVQLVTVRGDVKTNLEGTVLFQACNSHMCMPPASTRFSLMLQ